MLLSLTIPFLAVFRISLHTKVYYNYSTQFLYSNKTNFFRAAQLSSELQMHTFSELYEQFHMPDKNASVSSISIVNKGPNLSGPKASKSAFSDSTH